MTGLSDYLQPKNLLLSAGLAAAILSSSCVGSPTASPYPTPQPTAVPPIPSSSNLIIVEPGNSYGQLTQNGGSAGNTLIVYLDISNVKDGKWAGRKECSNLRALYPDDYRLNIVQHNVENTIEASKVRRIGGPAQFLYGDGIVIAAFDADKNALLKLGEQIYNNACNDPRKGVSLQQQFNPERYGVNGTLKPKYAPRTLQA